MRWESEEMAKVLRDAGYILLEADFTDSNGEYETYTVYLQEISAAEDS